MRTFKNFLQESYKPQATEEAQFWKLVKDFTTRKDTHPLASPLKLRRIEWVNNHVVVASDSDGSSDYTFDIASQVVKAVVSTFTGRTNNVTYDAKTNKYMVNGKEDHQWKY